MFFFMLLLTLALPVGLRTMYNDTGVYIKNFLSQETLSELLGSGKLHILRNPAYEIYTSLIRAFTNNYHIYLMIPALFVQNAVISFIRRYSPSLKIGIALYVMLGTYVFSMAAIKQVFAMAILLLAIPHLLNKKYLSFFLLTFIAFLFHTYAIAVLILPIFTSKPWKAQTFILLIVIFVVMNNFESAIGSFLEYANKSGKAVAEYEVFDGAQINTFRVLVYGVVPLLSLVLHKHLFNEKDDRTHHLIIHMSIISFSVMLLGTISGANMFGRMAQYFEFGIICGLPWIINKSFEKSSAKIVTTVALISFFLYFFYAYQINLVFDDHYRAITIIDFFKSLFSA